MLSPEYLHFWSVALRTHTVQRHRIYGSAVFTRPPHDAHCTAGLKTRPHAAASPKYGHRAALPASRRGMLRSGPVPVGGGCLSPHSELRTEWLGEGSSGLPLGSSARLPPTRRTSRGKSTTLDRDMWTPTANFSSLLVYIVTKRSKRLQKWMNNAS